MSFNRFEVISTLYNTLQDSLKLVRRKEDDNCAYFYTLTSKDTREVHFAQQRQRIMKQNGYDVRVLPYSKIKPTLRKRTEEKDLDIITNLINKRREMKWNLILSDSILSYQITWNEIQSNYIKFI